MNRSTLITAAALWFVIAAASAQSSKTLELPAVTITDSALRNPLPVIRLNSDALIKSPQSDLGTLLRGQPNVSGIRRGGYAVDPIVRVFRYSQLNIFLDDGIHIEGGCPNRMDPVLAHIEPELITSIEIIKGPYMSDFGPTAGAFIRVNTQPLIKYNHPGISAVSISGYDANRNGFRQFVSATGTGKKAYFFIGAGLKNYGDYTDGSGQEWPTAFHKKFVTAETGVKTQNNGQLRLRYSGTFGSEVYYPALPMDEMADNTQIFSAAWSKQSSMVSENNLKLSAYHTRVYHEMDNSFRPQYNTVVPPYTGLMQAMAIANTAVTGIRFQLQHKAGRLLIKGGADSELSGKDGTRTTRMIMQMEGQPFISVKKTNLWKDAWILNNGLYTGLMMNAGKLRISINARADINTGNSGDTLVIEKEGKVWFEAQQYTRVLLNANATGTINYGKYGRVSLSLARGARAADLQERFIKFLATGFDKYDYLGNPALKPEINYQADLTASYEPANLNLSLNVFRSEIRNFITGTLLPPAVARPVSMGAPGVKQFNNIHRAVIYGIEATAGTRIWQIVRVNLVAGYNYAYFPLIDKIIITDGSASGTISLKNDPVPEIPPFEATLRTTVNLLNGRLTPELSIRTVAAQKAVSEASYEVASPGFTLLDLAATYKICSNASLTAGVSNLTNQLYYEHLNRKITGTADKLYEPGRSVYLQLKITL